MPRPHPDPLVLFSLHPYHQNELAKSAIAHPSNVKLASTDHSGSPVLAVGFHGRGKSSTALATLGRGPEVDIYLEGPNISKLQCSFEIDVESGVIMFFDRSDSCTSQISGQNSKPFEQGRIRKVLVQDGFNTVIALGEGCSLYKFEMRWHQDPIKTAKMIKRYCAFPSDRVINSRTAESVLTTPTFSPFQQKTPPHTNEQQQFKIRYLPSFPELGSGQFGKVYRAVNVDTGKVMAVKILVQSTMASKQVEWRRSESNALEREVENLSRIGHPNIVDYIGSQGWFESQIEIFMGLKEGTLASLILKGADEDAIATRAYQHMLQALDYIANKGIVHRDVKPENILYITQPDGQFWFQLGDFGLCNRTVIAVTRAGTPIYMAPEVLSARREKQTNKVDVWSLLVTIVWTLDAGQFRQQLMTTDRFRYEAEVQSAIVRIATTDRRVWNIREMAILEPSQRASAAQMLVKHFGGEGLATERSKVPDLPNCSHFFPAPSCAAAAAATTTDRRDPTPALASAPGSAPTPAFCFGNYRTAAFQKEPVQSKANRGGGGVFPPNANADANADKYTNLPVAAASAAAAAFATAKPNPNLNSNTHTRASLSAAAITAAPNQNQNRVRKPRDLSPATAAAAAAKPTRNIPVLRPLESRLKMAQRRAD